MWSRRSFPLRLVWLVCLLAPGWRTASGAPKKKRKPEPQAVIAGTVFHKSGFSLRGVKVVVFDLARPKKKMRAVTDGRGEFAIRVPAGEARYQVEAQAKGFASQQREVEIYGMERINVNLILDPK